MASKPIKTPSFLLFLLFLLFITTVHSIGVNYGGLADNLPPPSQVAAFLQSRLHPRLRQHQRLPRHHRPQRRNPQSSKSPIRKNLDPIQHPPVPSRHQNLPPLPRQRDHGHRRPEPHGPPRPRHENRHRRPLRRRPPRNPRLHPPLPRNPLLRTPFLRKIPKRIRSNNLRPHAQIPPRHENPFSIQGRERRESEEERERRRVDTWRSKERRGSSVVGSSWPQWRSKERREGMKEKLRRKRKG